MADQRRARLSRGKLTPLNGRGSAVRFENVAVIEVAILVEVVVDRGMDGGAGTAADFPPNSGRVFKFGNKPGLVVLTEDGEWRAFSAVCTHLNCTVQYQSAEKRIWCACHNGVFDLNGAVAGGPPPKPLEEYAVNVRGDEVVVTRKA